MAHFHFSNNICYIHLTVYVKLLLNEFTPPGILFHLEKPLKPYLCHLCYLNSLLLVSISGSAHYLDDRRDKKEFGRQKLSKLSKHILLSVSVSFIYDSINRVESVTQEMRLQTDYYDDICKKVGKKGGPTHVVSSITRGFRGVLSFKKYVRWNYIFLISPPEQRIFF